MLLILKPSISLEINLMGTNSEYLLLDLLPFTLYLLLRKLIYDTERERNTILALGRVPDIKEHKSSRKHPATL